MLMPLSSSEGGGIALYGGAMEQRRWPVTDPNILGARTVVALAGENADAEVRALARESTSGELGTEDVVDALAAKLAVAIRAEAATWEVDFAAGRSGEVVSVADAARVAARTVITRTSGTETSPLTEVHLKALEMMRENFTPAGCVQWLQTAMTIPGTDLQGFGYDLWMKHPQVVLDLMEGVADGVVL